MDRELESVPILNPTSEDFTWRYNGEPHTIHAGEKREFAKPVACHLAKHLSTKIITDAEFLKLTKKQIENRNDPVHIKISQLNIYDTPERRIALYDIFLGNEQLVISTILAYPFKGFIGEMDNYKKYVESKKVKNTELESDSDS